MPAHAGAYDGEMKQITESVKVMDQEGRILVLDNDTMEFGYRTSIIKNRPFIVLEVVLRMQAGRQISYLLHLFLMLSYFKNLPGK